MECINLIKNCFWDVKILLNPYMMNGFTYCYELDESTFIFRGVRSDFYFFLSYFL